MDVAGGARQRGTRGGHGIPRSSRRQGPNRVEPGWVLPGGGTGLPACRVRGHGMYGGGPGRTHRSPGQVQISRDAREGTHDTLDGRPSGMWAASSHAVRPSPQRLYLSDISGSRRGEPGDVRRRAVTVVAGCRGRVFSL